MKRIGFILRSALIPKEKREDVPPFERPRVDDQGAGERPLSEDRTDNDKPKAPVPKAAPGGEKPSVPTRDEPEAPEEGEVGNGEYDLDGHFSEFYDRLHDRLEAYGLTSIPSFDELYGLLESFLRPAIDSAIAERNRLSRAKMAELDADAYARGMGSSSYLTSMKSRELDRAASDVSALEGKYASSMGEYLYKAISKMQEMEQELNKLSLSLSSSHSSHGSHSSNSSSGSSGSSAGEENDPRVNAEYGYVPYGHTNKGAYFDGVWYDGDFSYYDKGYSYADYVRYLKGLTPAERYLFFTSNAKEWRTKRWQVQYELPQVEYLDLVARFMRSTGNSTGGGEQWPADLY